MTRHSRISPAVAADMADADAALIAPILATFRRHLAAARLHTPGGDLPDDELHAVARTAARICRVTPEDLIRWHRAHPEV